jgi:hypothetical protein
MIALLKQWTNQTWEGARHLLADDLTHLATAMNQRWAATFTDANLLGLKPGGTGADLSATGGTGQFLKQASAGAVVTVVQPAIADLSNAANIALRNAQNTFSNTAGQIIQGPLDLTAATAGQIKFPATQNPSSDVNTLDDYEEGTWAPTDGSGASLVFTGVVARYIKIGQLVCCWGRIVYPATANAAGTQINGLPFTVEGSGPAYYGGQIFYANPGIAVFSIVVNLGTTNANFYDNATAAWKTNANLSLTDFRFMLVYRASA